MEVVGETVRLTGSAEEQYQKWREMLRDIYAAETGLPPDPNGEETNPIVEDVIQGTDPSSAAK